MGLKDLVGEHMLDAVDFSNEQVKTWGDEYEACQVMRFRLNGRCYIATEDPIDGYRSSMRELAVSDEAEMKNVFEPLKVVGRHRTTGGDDVLELIDVVNGKTVIEVGTYSVDDYYPGFVASFNPEAMAHNATRTRLSGLLPSGKDKMKFKKKPVVIEAIQYGPSTCAEICAWMGVPHNIQDGEPCGVGQFLIQTLEGEMAADPGDWIIKGVKGEFYPVKCDIFYATYDKVEEADGRSGLAFA